MEKRIAVIGIGASELAMIQLAVPDHEVIALTPEQIWERKRHQELMPEVIDPKIFCIDEVQVPVRPRKSDVQPWEKT